VREVIDRAADRLAAALVEELDEVVDVTIQARVVGGETYRGQKTRTPIIEAEKGDRSGDEA
jgi:hypothetical protein